MTAYCLLNHALTEKQTTELKDRFGSSRIMYPEAELSAAWSNVPTGETLSAEYLSPFVRWISGADKGDILVIQGEAGAVFALVDFALDRGLVPLHSVTQRIARENRDGEKVIRTHVFEHLCFRPYRYFSG
jgi:hypothetical protein